MSLYCDSGDKFKISYTKHHYGIYKGRWHIGEIINESTRKNRTGQDYLHVKTKFYGLEDNQDYLYKTARYMTET